MNRKIAIGLIVMILLVSFVYALGTVYFIDASDGEIIITKAMHLDKNKKFISDIYNEARAKDQLWSEPIYHNEIIRVTFEQILDFSRDITLYVRNEQALNTKIEVYYAGTNNKITEFPIISEEKYYKILLTGMKGSNDTFDLKIKNMDDNKNAYLEFEHIIDPACTVVDDSVIIYGNSPHNTTEQFNISAQFTCQSGGAVRTAHFDISLDYGTNTSSSSSEATTNLTSNCTSTTDFKFISAEFAGSCDNLANIGCTDTDNDGTITIDITNDPVTAIINWTVQVCPGTKTGSYDFDVKATSITDGLITFDNWNETSINNTDLIKPRINVSIFNVSSPKKGDVVNFTANITDNGLLDTCQFFMNGTSDGSFIILNKSITGNDSQCSQNWTIDLIRGNVINFTVLVNDTNNNKNQSEQIITVANFIPTPTIVFPTNDLKTNSQTLSLNVTYEADRDNDVINISYYINGKLNQTQIGLNTTFNASDGVYILNVSLFDNVTETSYSSNVTVNFTIDISKPNINLISPSTYFNSSSQNITFLFNFTNNLANQANCSIFIDANLNLTNSTTLNGTSTTFIISGIAEGFHNWSITCIENAGNSNTSETRNFTVDFTVPAINSISFSPNSTDDVDPNVLLNFSINITDYGSAVKTVIFQYKQSGAGTFTNATPRFDNNGKYYANFTPNIADTWNYKVYTEDYAGNNDTSNITNISVANDRTWKRSPGTFPNLACGFSKTCTTGNLTINNTGDFTLNFDLSSNFGATSFNTTEPFDLAAKEFKVVEINLTAGSSASESNVIITTDATTSNAEPDKETTNFTFTASAGGPVFEINIINPPTEVNRSSPIAFHLNASLKNIGNETAGTTWINWTLPANWLNISGTNLTKNLSGVSVNEVVYHNITVNLTSDASTGTQKVNVTAASNNSASNSASASIVVTETSTSTTTTTTTTTGGGGGGVSVGSSGGGSIIEVPVKPEEINISQNVEIIRGEKNSFIINVTNNFKNGVLYNLTLDIEGFLSQYLAISPQIIPELYSKQTKSFKVTVAAPAYKSYEEHTLKATVTGLLVKTEYIGNGTAVSKNPFTLRNYISLIIQEISGNTAGLSLDEAQKLIEEMQNAGFPVKKSLKILEKAKGKLNIKSYKSAEETSIQIKTIRDNAFAANELINDVKSKIQEAENKGLQVEETRRLLNLALAIFEREDFLTAIQKAKDAQLSIVIETKGKFNILKLIIDYWWYLSVALTAIYISSYFLRRQLALIIISRRLEDLQKEEVILNELIQETQEKYYKEKKISTTEYHKAMYGYEKRLNEVSQLISRLRSKRVDIIKIFNEIRNLKKENENFVALIRQLQDGYYNKQTITKKVYLKRIEEYKLRRVEIEKSIAVLETKIAKKEKLKELKEHGFKAKKQEQKEQVTEEPVPKHIIPENIIPEAKTHTKHNILRYFKEVHKDDWR